METLKKFNKKCLKLNGGEYEHGLLSRYLEEALTDWIDKNPLAEPELIDEIISPPNPLDQTY